MINTMYTVGMPILYGRTGVCRIEAIGPAPVQKHDGQRYYKLRAVFSTSGECIYIPVDTAMSMRPLINSDEAADYLGRLSQMKPQPLAPRNPVELVSHYQGALASGDPESILLLIKEIYLKEKELTAHHKKLGQVDSRYLKVAERLVCEEFAMVLQTTPESIKKRLHKGMLQ